MSQNITLLGASYTDVPSVQLPKTGGGMASFDDTTDADAVASDIAQGKTAYVNGTKLVGTSQGGGTDGYTLTNIVPTQSITTGTAVSSYATGGLITNYSQLIENGETYLVTHDNVEYVLVCYEPSVNEYMLGDYRVATSNTVVARLMTPFIVEYNESNDLFFLATRDTNTHTIKVDKITFIDPTATLVSKTITSNGTYNAVSDNADGYSQVTVNVASQGSAKNVQIANGVNRVATTTYTAVSGQEITVAETGTYDVYWSGYRSSTSGTSGSQLYIDDTAYGSANTTFSNNGQSVHLSNVSLTKNQVIAVRARARNTSSYMYVSNLTIIQN